MQVPTVLVGFTTLTLSIEPRLREPSLSIGEKEVEGK